MRTAKPSCATAIGTASERRVARATGLRWAAAGLLLLSAAAFAQRPNIYSCDVNGKRVTSDRPIAECTAKEQRILNADGSPRGVLPPSLTADERAEQERRDREAKAERDKVNDAIRRDKNLVQRYPDEAAHNKARAKALEELKASVRNSEERLAALKLERRAIDDEKKFYEPVCLEKKGKDCVKWDQKDLPSKLKLQIDANDAGLEAQTTLIQNMNTEAVRVNRLYDDELKRLRVLWKTGAGSGPTTLAAEPSKTSAR